MLCKYLLIERKQESELEMAFTFLAQERHNDLHTKSGHKTTESDFSDCGNAKCQAAFKVLQNRNQMAVEMNDLTVDLVNKFELKITGMVNRTVRAWLEPKSDIVKPGE